MSNKDLSIIIVDDLQFSRIVVKTALEKAGYTSIRMADSAAQALLMLEDKPAEVVLADWMMPEMDGLELTLRIRQRDEEKGTYTGIILFTANEGIEYLVKAFDHGVDDYLKKPPNPHELAARVNSAARLAAMQNDLLETSRQMEETIESLQKTSLIDLLTGAGNERLLISELESQIQDASARKGSVSLVMVELNEMPDILKLNDKEMLNEVLISVYRRLRRTVRPTDIVCRMEDGSVFAVLMRHTGTSEYKLSSMQRVVSAIDQRPFKTIHGNIEFSSAMGVQTYRNEDPSIPADEMISKAWDKLETSKQNTDQRITV